MTLSFRKNWTDAMRQTATSSVIFSLLLRPTDWPFPFDQASSYPWQETGNRLFCIMVVWLIAGTLSSMTTIAFTHRTKMQESGNQNGKPRVWPVSALAAVALGLAVDWWWADRPLQPDMIGIVPLEIRLCLVVFVVAMLSPILHRFWDSLAAAIRAKTILEPRENSQ